MHNEYINRLLNALKNVVITKADNGSFQLEYNNGMEELLKIIIQLKNSGKHLFFIGNGGSAAIASHMTADFMKNGGIKTYCLYDSALTTCMGNDYGYEYVFSKPLSLLLNDGDMVIAISSSGNSQNIVNAIQVARNKYASVITFTGFKRENTIRKMGDYNVYVPLEEYGIVESIHNLILQQLVDQIMEIDGVKL